MHPQPSPSPEPVTLKEEFRRFLAHSYINPPSPDDPRPAMRLIYTQLRCAFYLGAALALTPSPQRVRELADFANEDLPCARAEAQGACS